MQTRLKYLTADRSRHGQTRYYVRLPGIKKKIRIWLEPKDPDFLLAYQAALEGRQLAKKESLAQTPASPTLAIPGTFRALCQAYLSSSVFKASNHETRQRTVRGILEHCCEELTKPGSGLVMGDTKLAIFSARHVIVLRDRKAATPMAANNRIKEIRRVFNWAQAEDPDRVIPNPAAKVQLIPHESQGFHSWTLSEVAQYEKRWSIGTRERLALDLLLYTAQRRSDVVKFGAPHIDGHGWLVFRQGKTGTAVEMPLITPLAESIAATLPIYPPAKSSKVAYTQFLRTSFGKPYSSAGFGNWFRECCDAAGLPHCSAHGLRKATAARLAELGCSEEEIAAITGHLDPNVIKVYTRGARRRVMADSAMQKLEASLSRKQG